MEAFYEKKESTIRRVDYTSLTLNANMPDTDNGGRVNREGLKNDKHEYADTTQNKLVLDYQVNNFEAHLKDYIKNFTNINGYKLIGWDREPGGDYIPDFYPDAVVGVDKEQPVPNNLYAVWEPIVYLTLNNSTQKAVTFDLKFEKNNTAYTGETNIVEEYLRYAFINGNADVTVSQKPDGTYTATLSPGKEVKLAIPEGFYYGVENQRAFVHGYQGEESDVVIREKFLSFYVTSVDSFAFFRNETIETLSLYDATMLDSLGQCAFAECPNLRYAEIPSTVQTLGNSVFDTCTSLSYVRFREGSATQIPLQAFYGCSSLETVLLENSVTSIGDRAFYGCTSLEELNIPKSVTSISDSAFNNCPLLTLGVWYGSYAFEYAIDKNIPYTLLDGVKLGDSNGDGLVNINDVTALQRHLAELETLEGIFLIAADCNQNDSLNIDDATLLQSYLAEYEIQAPIGEVITQ